MNKEILTMTAADLLSALKKRELSSCDVTEAFLCRAENDTSSAYVTIDREYSLARAREADRLIAKGEGGPLCGLPAAVKDNIAVGGMRMTCASKMLADFVPPYTASVIEKSGSVVLGKTNLDEFAMGSDCSRSIFGSTKNPRDNTRSAGGSSGGSAAAVAGYMATWALGTDTGGSCRQPASFCGITAMKPTYGLVSRYGVTELASSMDTVCPMTRGVYDNAMILDAIGGRDSRDMTSLDMPGSMTERIGEGVGGMKIALMKDAEKYCEAGMADALKRAAEKFERMGAGIEEISLPSPGDISDAYFVIVSAECSSNFARYDGLKYGLSADGDSYAEIMANTRDAGFGSEVKRRIMAGAYVLSETMSGDRYRRVGALRSDLRRQMDEIFSRYDFLLMPTAAGCAFGLGDYDRDSSMMYMSDCFTALANLTGNPAITLPVGGNGNLPYGGMIMGGRMNDAAVYRAAYALEGELQTDIGREVSEIAL